MGDFDSAEKPVFDNIEIFPSEKDDTDLMLAIKEGFESGCDDFLIFGATGGRVDHLLGNIQSLGYILSCGGEGMIAADREIFGFIVQEVTGYMTVRAFRSRWWHIPIR